MEVRPLFTQTDRYDVMLIPRPRGHDPDPPPDPMARRRWYSPREVAAMLGYSLSKTKMLVITGEIRSIKDGKLRRILPEWVDEYVARKAAEVA